MLGNGGLISFTSPTSPPPKYWATSPILPHPFCGQPGMFLGLVTGFGVVVAFLDIPCTWPVQCCLASAPVRTYCTTVLHCCRLFSHLFSLGNNPTLASPSPSHAYISSSELFLHSIPMVCVSGVGGCLYIVFM